MFPNHRYAEHRGSPPPWLFSHSFPEAWAPSSPLPSLLYRELGVDGCRVGQVTAKVKNGSQLWTAVLGTTRKIQNFGIRSFEGPAKGWLGLGRGFLEMEFQGASTTLGRKLSKQQYFLSPSHWQSVVLRARQLGAALRNVAPGRGSERRQELIRTSSDTEEGPGSSSPTVWRRHQSFVLPSAENPLLP